MWDCSASVAVTRTRPGSWAVRALLALAVGVPGLAWAADLAGVLVEIPGGTYVIGSDDGPSSSQPAHSVELAPFRIAATEVTNAAYVRYLNALEDVAVVGNASPGAASADDLQGPLSLRLLESESHREAPGDAPSLIGLADRDSRIALRDGRFEVESGFADHPVTEVTWYGAQAYCAWLGRRLPTEAEWEAAARGKEGRIWPWGDTPPTEKHAAFDRRRGDTASVGSHPAGATPRGVHDLAGNLAEWTHSLFRPYPYDAADGREDSDTRGERVTRGGDYVFDTTPQRLATYFRDGFSRDPERGHRHIGFRCADD